MRQLRVSVPATSANLGPGFDALGIALGLYNHFTCAPAATLSFSGVVAGPRDHTNLFARAFAAVMDKADRDGNVSVAFDCAIPPARGLGSSSALIVGGAVAANHMYDCGLDESELLQICNEIEGHPDNVAPALAGNLTASFALDGHAYTRSLKVDPRFKFAVLIPNFELSTAAARAALPAQVSHADAVFNLSRAAAVPLAFAAGDTQMLAAAMDDRLHQPYRFGLIEGAEQLRQITADCGALATVISGAGPTLLTVWDGQVSEQLGESLRAAKLDQAWQLRQLELDTHGAQVSA